AICNPIPQGSLENKASQLLDAKHGNCYSDIEKLQSDLKWLAEQGFINHKKDTKLIEPPEADMNFNREIGGLSRYAEKDSFIRVMSLIRYLIFNPFDDERSEEDKENKITLHDHYI